MYDPLIDKRPYGATAIGQRTIIRFPLSRSIGVKRVFMIFRGVYGEGEGQSFSIELPLKKSTKNEDIFEGEFVPTMWGIFNYRFEGELAGGGLAFFGRGENGRAIRGDWLPEWQLTISKHIYKTPNWAKKGVTYQIFADRFCKREDRPFLKNGRLHVYWNERPDIEELGKSYRADDFFGGNLSGIISKLDYLESMGVTLIYLTPIFKSGSNHRYDTGDYMSIDELFGDEEQLRTLVEEGKRRGIAVMLDGVFNHTGADSLYFNKFGNYPSVGAYQSKDSPYYDWYYFNEHPDMYHCWWGSTVVPTVNKSAEGYRQLVLGRDGAIEKWSKMGVKGWRLDVVDELPIEFTTELCQKIKQMGKDMLIVGEVWEDASVKIAYDKWRPYFMGEQLDSVMNYPFKQAILDFALGGDVRAFRSRVTSICEHYPKQSLDVLMNIIGSHDTVRALTYLSGVEPPKSKHARWLFSLGDEEYKLARERLELASILQYTLPGVPCLYYGDEAGSQGFEDPLNRGTYPWGQEDRDLLGHYRALGGLRRQYADLLRGELHFVDDDELLVYVRKSSAGKLLVLANNTDRDIARPLDGIDALSGSAATPTIPARSAKIVILSK